LDGLNGGAHKICIYFWRGLSSRFSASISYGDIWVNFSLLFRRALSKLASLLSRTLNALQYHITFIFGSQVASSSCARKSFARFKSRFPRSRSLSCAFWGTNVRVPKSRMSPRRLLVFHMYYWQPDIHYESVVLGVLYMVYSTNNSHVRR